MKSFEVPGIIEDDETSLEDEDREEEPVYFNSQERSGEDEGPFSLEDLEGLVEVSYLPTIEQLCEREHITQDELPRVIGQKIQCVLIELQKDSQSNSLSQDLLFVGECFRALEKVDEAGSDTLIALKNSLADYESVKENYFNGVSLDPSDLKKFRRCVTKIYREIYPEEMLRIPKKRLGISKRRNYQLLCADQEEAESMSWIKHKDKEDNTVYVTERVLADLASMKQENTRGYFHSTSSSVFKGLIQHKALLSRDKLKEREQEVLTSEGDDSEKCIYADRYFNHGYHYSDVIWFNEYSVTFLIDSKKQQESFAPDRGIGLGKEVPIEHIKMMFVPRRSMDKAKEWAKENIPWITVHAVESGHLLGDFY